MPSGFHLDRYIAYYYQGLPTALYVWDASVVDGLVVALDQSTEVFPAEVLAVQHLGAHFENGLLSKLIDLVYEFRPQFIHVYILEILEVGFVQKGSHHGETLSLLEESEQQSAYPVFLFGVV